MCIRTRPGEGTCAIWWCLTVLKECTGTLISKYINPKMLMRAMIACRAGTPYTVKEPLIVPAHANELCPRVDQQQTGHGDTLAAR